MQQLVVIHDAAVYAVPHAYSVVFRAWYKFMLPLLGKMAMHLITVSQFSRSELVRYCGYDEVQITVVQEGSEHILTQTPDNTMVCGDAALYCDPYDPTDIAEKIVQVLHDRGKQDDMRHKGLKQAAKYSWEKAALSVWAVVEKVIAR